MPSQAMADEAYRMQAERAERGPRIIAHPPASTVTAAEHEQKARDEGKTGIRRSEYGGWLAIVDGRLVDVWRGPGSKLNAIRAAGTNEVLA